MSERRTAAAVFLGAILLLACRDAAAQTAPETAPPVGTGTIAGQVIDAATGDPIIEAGVEVIGVKGQIRTDLDGRYSVKVPAGTYQVRFFAPLYQGARLEKVVVQPNKTATADVPLKPEGKAGVEVVEVVAQASKAAEATQLIKRQKAAVVSDNISAETIKKSPDANAAEIVQRVPAVTIKDEKFIFVRGLGERYSSAILEGNRLPSPDPDRRVVPLDLFPAEFIDSISIAKTYSADLPGDFSGGLADIQLLDFPQQLTYGFGLSTSGNSNTTFQDFNTYKGSGKDYFGFGGDYRKIPSIVPDRNLGESGNTPPSGQLGAFGRAFKDIWETDTKDAPIDFKTSFQVGDRWGPFGARLAGVYETKYRSRQDREIQYLSTGGDNPTPRAGNDFKFDRSDFTTRLGGVFTAAYEISPAHRLNFRSFIDRNTQDQTLVGSGTLDQTGDAQGSSTEFRYTQDELDFGQLSGNHHFSLLDVDWRTALSRTTQSIPDWRFVTRQQQGEGGPLVWTDDARGGDRVFGDLKEYLTDSQVDFTIPFSTGLPFTDVWSGLPAKFKFGPAYLYRSRDSSLRTFHFTQTRGDVTSIDFADPNTNDILDPKNIGGGPPFPISFSEGTLQQDSFRATHEIAAGYLLFDLPLVRDRLRLIAGVRTEYSYLRLIDVFDVLKGERTTIIKNNLDPLPGVNLVYSPRSDMNVRASWSKTVSRPDFRELSPAVYPASRGLRATTGNPRLVETGVDSYDVRWEWFYTPTELVSLSGFYKTIDKPIEQATDVAGSAPQDTFRQNKDGKLAGCEFEGRKNLGFVSPYLQYVNVLTNVTYVHSDVTAFTFDPFVSPDSHDTRKRKLQGQSDYVVNAALEYAHPDWGTVRLLYNTVGPTIFSVQDQSKLPDIITERRDQLDLVYLGKINPFGVPLNVKLSVENLLNDNYLRTVGGMTQEDYKTGVTASLGIGYTY